MVFGSFAALAASAVVVIAAVSTAASAARIVLAEWAVGRDAGVVDEELD